MHRFDLYSTVHKGLRAALFDAARLVARTDFAWRDECDRASAALRRMFEFLDEHAAHEDTVLLPELSAIAPALQCVLAEEHARLAAQERVLAGWLDRLDRAPEAERVSLGRRVHQALSRLVEAQLAHMSREEEEASRALWAHRSDAELAALEARIAASIPAERMEAWMALLLPAVSGPERAAVEALAAGGAR